MNIRQLSSIAPSAYLSETEHIHSYFKSDNQNSLLPFSEFLQFTFF